MNKRKVRAGLLALALVLTALDVVPSAASMTNIDPPPAAMHRAELMKRQAKKEHVKAERLGKMNVKAATALAPIVVPVQTGTLIYNVSTAKCFRFNGNMGKKDPTGSWKFLAIWTTDVCANGGKITSVKATCLAYEGNWHEYQNCSYTRGSYGGYDITVDFDWGFEPPIVVPYVVTRDDVDVHLLFDAKGHVWGTWYM